MEALGTDAAIIGGGLGACAAALAAARLGRRVILHGGNPLDSEAGSRTRRFLQISADGSNSSEPRPAAGHSDAVFETTIAPTYRSRPTRPRTGHA